MKTAVIAMKASLVFSIFKGLSLKHLEKSLYSLSRQTVKADDYILFDNNSGLDQVAIMQIVSRFFDAKDWTYYFAHHDGDGKTLSWANNRAIRLATHDTFVFTRGDYIYDFHFCERMIRLHAGNPMSYATAWMWGMAEADLEIFGWRENPQRLLAHSEGARPERNSHIDGPTFVTSKQAMDSAGWYDETLVGWGFDQQDLQTHMASSGVKMVVIEEFLYFHMDHPASVGERSLDAARAIWLKSPRRTPEILEAERKIRLEKMKFWKPAFSKIRRIASDIFPNLIKP